MADSLEGTQIPAFNLESTEGKTVSSADLRGSWTVLYFYPKDDTEGCTKEACSFTASLGMFQKMNARVYGISKDSVASHRKFIEKYGLKFPLLADPKGDLVKALGAAKNPKFLAALLGLPARDTFLIDPEGKIAKVWRNVDPEQTVNVAFEELKKRV
ncbi:MAG: peroxiredoxin [Leptospirales bacterium]|nr:peroxiredoxin [Leptospirales bacterium]